MPRILEMHKNPVGKRFFYFIQILLSNLFHPNIKKEKFLNNYNKFWVIENGDPISNTLNKIDQKIPNVSLCMIFYKISTQETYWYTFPANRLCFFKEVTSMSVKLTVK